MVDDTKSVSTFFFIRDKLVSDCNFEIMGPSRKNFTAFNSKGDGRFDNLTCNIFDNTSYTNEAYSSAPTKSLTENLFIKSLGVWYVVFKISNPNITLKKSTPKSQISDL